MKKYTVRFIVIDSATDEKKEFNYSGVGDNMIDVCQEAIVAAEKEGLKIINLKPTVPMETCDEA